jgi:phosphatidyl-myo-inositol dimannoside synthase
VSADGDIAANAPRLLVLSPDFPPDRGGVQALVHGLVLGLRGFRMRVVTLDAPGGAAFDHGVGVPVRRVAADRRLRAARNLPLNAVALREAVAFRPQLALSAHIVTSPAAAAMRRVLGVRTVQYFHANEIPDKPRLAAFAAREADASIAVSTYTRGLLERAGASPASIALIPPGVTMPLDPAPLPRERPTVLTVARLRDDYKGHDVLLRSLPLVLDSVPDAQWVVIGEGPLREELEAEARGRGLAGAVRFLGAVSDEERDAWLRRADVFAMPSRLPGGRLAGEGFGIAYLEASAYGKPVVAGAVGGAVDAVLDGQTGLLVDPSDHAAVGRAITRLLLDPDLAGRLGEAGRARARELAWPRVAARVQALLLELLT